MNIIHNYSVSRGIYEHCKQIGYRPDYRRFRWNWRCVYAGTTGTRRGYDLILVARDKTAMDKLAKDLAAGTGVSIRVLPADLTVEADLHRVEDVLRDDQTISLLVNNAGAATLGAFYQADIARLSRDIQLNVVAPTRLAHAVLPGLLARNRGGLINIASVMSQMVQPGNSVYGATKSYLLHSSAKYWL